MEAVKKYWLWGIFISVLAIFAMSHNANAVTLTYNLNNYRTETILNNPRLNCSFLSNDTYTTGSNVFTCNYLQSNQVSGSADQQGLVSILTTGQYSLKKGDLIEFYFTIQSPNFIDIPVSFTNVFQNFTVLDYSLIDTFGISDFQGEITDLSGNSHTLLFDEYTSFYRLYRVVLRVEEDGTRNIGLASSSYIFRTDTNNLGARFYFTIKGITLYRFVGDEANKEQEEKTQEAVDDSQAAGGSSSSQAQTGTTGLLNAISGAVNVIAAASPTNCKINGNMGNLDMGQLDLCANPAPAFIQTIGSLILILICVPLAISLFNRFIAIFRSFQS